ncbi:MAG TPA: xanthine dehydrogenase family protein molybdopterin-binding subunit [Stellaceae bacterium]|nr:xanthine dehydrogenase family protein molybdopterin-binding subunit [Stellaceae bacterium]
MTAVFKGRREDQRLVTGAGRYTADWNLPGQLHAVFVRSDRAHAEIRTVDTSAAERAPGVVAVFTGRDVADAGIKTLPPLAHFPGRGGMKLIVPERPVLALDRVRHTGEEIAVVIAETREAALDAAELVEVEYAELPAVIGFDAALAPGATQVHDSIPGNVCFDFEYGDEAKTAETIARADRVVRVALESPRVAPNTMETRGALAAFDEATGRYEIHCGHQGGPAMRDALAFVLGVAPDKVRVHMVDVGGAFGARTAPYAEHPLLLWVARRLRRPIKWISTRSEDFLTDNHGRAIRVSGELALDQAGRFLALRTDWLCDSGAYLSQAGVLTNSMNGLTMGAGAYRVEALYGRHRQIMTNTAPTNAFRGAGRPEAAFIVERLVDEAAVALGIDPWELRRRNVIRKDEMPYKTRTGSVFDSADFPGLIDLAERQSDWRDFPARRAEAARRGRLRGIGCAVFIEPSGGGGVPKDQVAIRFERSGRITLYNAAGPSGQSYETIFPEMVGAWLGIDPERIDCRPSDPDGPDLIGGASIGSRSAMSQGTVYKIASDEVIRKGLALAADALEAASADVEFRDGSYFVKGTDRAIALAEIVERHKGAAPHPLDTISEWVPQRAFPSGAHVAEIEIDAETGAAEIVRYTAVDDVGAVVNHVLAEGQLHGGVMQSAGQVFGEECRYDAESGQLLAGSFMDYVMPHADLVLDFRTAEHCVPSPNNLLGAKGAGEAGTTGGLPTCMNAVLDALRAAGVASFDMPATPARLWAALRQGRGKGA